MRSRDVSFSRVAVFFVGLWFASSAVHAQAITFRKIADTQTPIPGGTGNFTSFPDATLFGFRPPSFDGGDSVFAGAGSGGQIGIYTDTGGTLHVVADTNTPIPGGTGNFTGFSSTRTRTIAPPSPSIGAGRVAFIGAGVGGQIGVYTDIGGTLHVVADTNTAIPGGTGNFTNFDFAATDGQNVAFLGIDGSGPTGVYMDTGGTLVVVADGSTLAPGGTGNFVSFEGTTIDTGHVTFLGFASGVLGIYTNIGGTLGVVLDNNTPIPGGTGNFVGLGILASTNGGNAVVRAGDAMNNLGIYTDVGGSLRVVADKNTFIPGGTGNFLGFSPGPSIDGGNVAFSGNGAAIGGIFAEIDGSLINVIDSNHSVNGKPVSLVESRNEAMSGDSVAFFASFDDGSSGIFVATVQRDVCGNGLLETGETCDDGIDNGRGDGFCLTDCSAVQTCGDGLTNGTEACDDGAGNSDTAPDACRTNCTLPTCGDRVVDSGETCDDGNRVGGDGCSASCLREVAGVPTVSTWGLAVVALMLLTWGRILFGRRRSTPP